MIELNDEFYLYYEVEGETFDTKEEATDYAEKVLGFNKEWIIYERYERLLDANYVNYN